MTMLAALSARQHDDGSFGWFPGMNGSVWMTSEVATLLVRLGAIRDDVLSVPERQILDKAMSFLAKEMHEDVEALRKEKNPTLSFSQLRYLYIYIMCKEKTLTTSPEGEETTRYLLSLLKKQAGASFPLWEDREGLELRALAAIVLKRAGEEKKALALMPRIHELLRHNDGAYLAYPGGSFTSIDRKVETHVTLMEAVQTVEPKETDLLARMAEWLIRQKRTQEWEQPVQSADAVYALVRTTQPSSGGDWSGTLTYDGQTRKLQAQQPFAGYVRERIDPIAKPKELRIGQKALTQRGSGEGAVLSWGAVYAQYQIPADKAESHREGMTIRRETLPNPPLKGGSSLRLSPPPLRGSQRGSVGFPTTKSSPRVTASCPTSASSICSLTKDRRACYGCNCSSPPRRCARRISALPVHLSFLLRASPALHRSSRRGAPLPRPASRMARRAPTRQDVRGADSGGGFPRCLLRHTRWQDAA